MTAQDSSPRRYRIGVCSWSLEPADADELAERVHRTGVEAVQLALDPIRLGQMGVGEVRARLREAGVGILSGMMAMAGEDYSTLASIRQTGGVVPDGTWAANLAAARELARIAGELQLDLVSFHAGFVPHHAGAPARAMLIQRIRELADIYGAHGVQLALETGQEHAGTLAELLDDLAPARVGVNFDPANLILYGMGDPAAALDRLGERVLQLHIKDALPAVQDGEWGTEVPVGEGAVDWAAVLDALRRCPAVTALVIEREAGPDRVGDVIRARRFLEQVLQ